MGFHYIGAQKFAPKGWVSGVAFTWGSLYTSFARQVMEARFKSDNILGSLADDFLTIAPFGSAVPADVVGLVNARKQEFMAGTASPFQGPIARATNGLDLSWLASIVFGGSAYWLLSLSDRAIARPVGR